MAAKNLTSRQLISRRSLSALQVSAAFLPHASKCLGDPSTTTPFGGVSAVRTEESWRERKWRACRAKKIPSTNVGMLDNLRCQRIGQDRDGDNWCFQPSAKTQGLYLSIYITSLTVLKYKYVYNCLHHVPTRCSNRCQLSIAFSSASLASYVYSKTLSRLSNPRRTTHAICFAHDTAPSARPALPARQAATRRP